ncbi:MAG: T9SS type A sorting domain-containing protein [Cryomorphaceae bacterium]|nr:T9SS type A sorting domain-containing protein [Cryomorphaceae bacterium]
MHDLFIIYLFIYSVAQRVLLIVFSLLTTTVFGQTLNPVSLEQLVNTDVPSTQYCPVVAADDQGNYMVFWTMSYYAGAIQARRYDNNHQPISDEITVNADNSKLMVAHYWEDGKFVLSYIENSSNNLKFVIINPDNSLEAEVTVLNNIENFDVDINGDTLAFVYNGTASNSQIYLRGYNLNNNAWINAQVLVTESSGVNYSEPNVVIHPNGRMTVIYHQYILVSGCCDYYRNIMRKTFSSSFLAEIPEEIIWYVDSEYNVGSDLDAEGNAAGEVIIATTHGTVFSSRHLRIWILSASGSFIVNNDQVVQGGSNDWYDNIECHLYDNGDFLITKSIRTGGYTNPNGNEAYVISGNNYNQSNTGLLQLNATNSGDQEYVALAVFPTGGFVTAWAGNGFQGDTQGIYSRAYNTIAFPGLNAGVTSYQVNESGSTTAIPIVLNTQPTDNVTVEITSANAAEVTVSPSTLTFTIANWNTAQYVNAQGIDDAADDGNVSVSITLSTASSADVTYAGLASNSVNVTNLDNDATITAPGDQSICQNAGLSAVNAIVTNNGGNINTVTAISGNTSVVDNGDIAVVNLGGGQYSISLSNLANNTLGTATITIQAQDDNFTYTDQFDVEVIGVSVALNTEDLNICEGEEVTLTATGATSLSWTNGVQNNVAFTPSETATYTVTASNGGNCFANAAVTVTVNETAAMPNISASSVNVCAGDEVTLIGTGPTMVTWSNGVQNGVAFIPTQTTTYTAVGSEGNDCTSSNTIQVVVNSVPNAPQILTTAEEICSGTGVTLLALGNESMIWDNEVENNVEFFPSMTETYTVTATNAGGCSADATITIIVNESAAVPNITASSVEVCAGESVTLIAFGPTSITWDNGVVNGAAFNPTETTTYTVIGDEGNDCTSSNSIEVVVNTVPNTPQILSTSQEICSGTGVTLFAIGNINLTWDNGIENNVEFFPTQTATYTVTGNDGSSCSSTASIEIIVNQSPAIPTITLFNGGFVSSAINGNQWYLDGEPIQGATGQTYTYTGPGDYTVIVTANGCSSTSAIEVIAVGIEELLNTIEVYPNPAETVLNIKGQMLGAQFNLFDTRGQMVRSSILTANSTSVDIADLANGVYMATFTYNNFVHHVKLVKQ